MKLTRKELNILIESFLFEQEETEESAEEEELPEIIIRIIKKNGTDSGISIVLRKMGQRIQAFIKKAGKETKLNTEAEVKAALFGALSHAYETMKDADSRELLVKWIEATVDGGIKTFGQKKRRFGLFFQKLKERLFNQ